MTGNCTGKAVTLKRNFEEKMTNKQTNTSERLRWAFGIERGVDVDVDK